MRARRVQGRGDDSVVKLRPVVPDQLSAELRRAPNLVVEVDAMPGGFVCSASMKGVTRDRPTSRRPSPADATIRKLFSKEQRSFFDAHAPEGIGLDDLSILGPITVLKAKVRSRRLRPPAVRRRDLVLPGRIAHPRAVHQVRAGRGVPGGRRGEAFLAAKGVDLSGEQQTKTKTALEFFAAELAS